MIKALFIPRSICLMRFCPLTLTGNLIDLPFNDIFLRLSESFFPKSFFVTVRLINMLYGSTREDAEEDTTADSFVEAVHVLSVVTVLVPVSNKGAFLIWLEKFANSVKVDAASFLASVLDLSGLSVMVE